MEFKDRDGGDPRWAVVPGVLHSEPVWGNGTTEYALDAMMAAAMGKDFVCPIDLNVTVRRARSRTHLRTAFH